MQRQHKAAACTPPPPPTPWPQEHGGSLAGAVERDDLLDQARKLAGGKGATS